MTAGTDHTIRQAQEVVEDHLRRREQGDLEGDIATNYHPDVVLISHEGVHRGHEGVRKLDAILHRYVRPQDFEIVQLTAEERFALLRWWAEGERAVAHDGADSFTVEDGLIVCQTIHYGLEEPESDPSV